VGLALSVSAGGNIQPAGRVKPEVPACCNLRLPRDLLTMKPMHCSRTLPVRLALALAMLLALAGPSQAQQRRLRVGDSAPGLDIERWVTGDETTIDSGTVYVITFFTSDSDNSKKALAMLTELQRDLGDQGLKTVAVSWEEADVVRRFASSADTYRGVTIAADRREGTRRAWIEAAQVNQTPVAFIVDNKSKIAWIGNPVTSQDFTSVLKRVLGGRYDPRLEAQAKPGIQGAANARKVKNWRMAEKYFDEVVALDASVFASVALDKFEMLLIDMDAKDRAYEYARQLIAEDFSTDGGALQMLAEKIATDPRIPNARRDLDVALDAAQAARNVIGEDDPKAMAGVALIRFTRGEVDKAVDLQKQAYFKAAPKYKPGLRRQLDIYQQALQRQNSMKEGG